MNWIRVEDELPLTFQNIYVLTDCEECPVLPALFNEEFVVPVIIQCEKHYETDQKFYFLKTAGKSEHREYVGRITHWMPLPEPPEFKKNELD